MTRLKPVRKVLLYTLLLNLSVAGAKIIYGHSIDSISMLSDGFHSFFDGTSNIIGIFGIWIASMPPDKSHPYGHRKFETLSIIAIAALIFGAGFEILKEAYTRFHNPEHIEVTMMSFMIMAVTLAVNFFVMTYESSMGRKLKSEFLSADAKHTKTDIYVSFSVVISLIAARYGYPIVDVISALIIAVFISVMGFEILKSAAAVLTDAACIAPEDIEALVMSVSGVKGTHNIRTRGTDNNICIDLHIFVDPGASTKESHATAHAVKSALEEKFPGVSDVVIHVEPFEKYMADAGA